MESSDSANEEEEEEERPEKRHKSHKKSKKRKRSPTIRSSDDGSSSSDSEHDGGGERHRKKHKSHHKKSKSKKKHSHRREKRHHWVCQWVNLTLTVQNLLFPRLLISFYEFLCLYVHFIRVTRLRQSSMQCCISWLRGRQFMSMEYVDRCTAAYNKFEILFCVVKIFLLLGQCWLNPVSQRRWSS